MGTTMSAKRVVAKQQVCVADMGRAAQPVAAQPVQAVDCGRGALHERALGRSILRGSISPTYRDVITQSIFLRIRESLYLLLGVAAQLFLDFPWTSGAYAASPLHGRCYQVSAAPDLCAFHTICVVRAFH